MLPKDFEKGYHIQHCLICNYVNPENGKVWPISHGHLRLLDTVAVYMFYSAFNASHINMFSYGKGIFKMSGVDVKKSLSLIADMQNNPAYYYDEIHSYEKLAFEEIHKCRQLVDSYLDGHVSSEEMASFGIHSDITIDAHEVTSFERIEEVKMRTEAQFRSIFDFTFLQDMPEEKRPERVRQQCSLLNQQVLKGIAEFTENIVIKTMQRERKIYDRLFDPLTKVFEFKCA